MDIIRKRVPKFAKLPLLPALALLAVAAAIGIGQSAATTPAAQAQTSAAAPIVSTAGWHRNDPGKTIYRPGDVATVKISVAPSLANQAVTLELWKYNWITAHHGGSTRQFHLARIDSNSSSLYYEYTVKAADVGFGGSGHIEFGKYDANSPDPAGTPASTGQHAQGICSQAAGVNCPADQQFRWQHKSGTETPRQLHIPYLFRIPHSHFQISDSQPTFEPADSNPVRILLDPDAPLRYLAAGEPVSIGVQIKNTNLHPRHHIAPAMADANYVMLTVGKNTAAKAKLSSITNNSNGGYLVYTYVTQASDYAGYDGFIPSVRLNPASQAASKGICSQGDGNACAEDYALPIRAMLPTNGATPAELGQYITPIKYEVSFPDNMPTAIEVASHTPYTAADGPRLPAATVSHGSLTYTVNDHDTQHGGYPTGLKLVPTNDGLAFVGTTNAATTATNHYRFKITAVAQDGVTKAVSDPIDLRVVNRQGPTFDREIPSDITVYQDWNMNGDVYVFPTATAIDDATITYDLLKWENADSKGKTTTATHSNIAYDQDTRTLSATLDGSNNVPSNGWYYTYQAHDGVGGITSHDVKISVKERVVIKKAEVAAPTANGVFKVGEAITATVTFWDGNMTAYDYPYYAKAVKVAPAPAAQPYLNLQIGSHVRQAQLVARQDGNPQHQLQFSYTVTAADQDPDGISMGNDALQNSEGITGTETWNASPARNVIPAASVIVNSDAHRVNGGGALPTYEGVTDPVITLYMDRDPNTHQISVLPKPKNVANRMTYTLTETDGSAIPAGLKFNAADRTVSIGEGHLPKVGRNTPTAVQYRLTATDSNISLSVSTDVTIRYAYRSQAIAYTIAGPRKLDSKHDSGTYQPGDVIEFRINYRSDITKADDFDPAANILPILIGDEKETAQFTRLDNFKVPQGDTNGNNRQAVFSYTLQTGDTGQISVPESGPNAPGIIGGADKGAEGYGEPVNPRLPKGLNTNNRFYGKYGTPDVGPYTGVNRVSAAPQVMTYEDVDNPVINLYHDGGPDTYGTDILPEPQNAGTSMTYTLTKANGDPIPAGLVFTAGTRKVSISAGAKPPKSTQYRLTATNSNTGISASTDVTIRHAQRPQPTAYTIAGPRKPIGQHDSNTYEPGDEIDIRINYNSWLAKTSDFVKADNYLPILIGTAQRTATFERLDVHKVIDGAGDHQAPKQAVFSYTLKAGDGGVISVPPAGLHAPGIIGGADDAGGTGTTGYGEVINPHLPTGLNAARFYGKTAESTTRYTGKNSVTAAPQSLTFDGTGVKSSVTLYNDGSNPYTPPAPLHAVAPVTWSLSPNEEIKLNDSSGMLSTRDYEQQPLLDGKAYVVTATDSRGLTASFNIAVTVQKPPLLTPIKIRSDAVGKGGDEISNDGYYSKVGGTLVWTLTYPQAVLINTQSEDSEKQTKLRLQIGKHIREVPAHGNGADSTEVTFRYQLQATDTDDQITIADPPLLNPQNIGATVDGAYAMASSNSQDPIWNWPVGTPIANQVTKVDGNPQAPAFPDNPQNAVILLAGQGYNDPDQDYLRNTLSAAVSPTIANYGPLTYSIKVDPHPSLRHGAKLHVKDGVPTIWTGNSGAAYDEPTQTHTLVATDFRGRTARMDFTIDYERAAKIDAGPAVPAVLATGDLLIIFLRHKQALTDVQKTAAASTKMTIRTGDPNQPSNTWKATYNATESTNEMSVYTYTVKSTDQEASVMHISVPDALQNNALYAQGEIAVKINPDGPPRWNDAGFGAITCDTMSTEHGGTCLLPTASNGFGELTYHENHIKILGSNGRYTPPSQTSLDALPGITTAVKDGNYVVTADNDSRSPSGIKFAYKVCDTTATPADIDNRAATRSCTNERQVTIKWAPRPYTTNVAISNEATGVSPEGSKIAKQGDQITVTLTLGRQSKVLPSATADQRPYIELDIGGVTRRASPVSEKTRGSVYNNKLDFRYEVQASDHAPNGASVKKNGFKNCAAIVTDNNQDIPDYDRPFMADCALPSHPASTTPVQGQRPTDAAIASDVALIKNGETVTNPTGVYADGTRFSKQGDDIAVTLTLGENSKVLDTTAADQRPYVELDIGGVTRQATLYRNSTNRRGNNWQLHFVYEVQAGDYSASGVSVKQNGFKNCAAVVTTVGEVPLANCALTSHPTSDIPVQGQRRADGKAEYDLDADDDGLIEISTTAQLNLMRHDIDANGNIDGVPNAHGTVSLADAALAYYQTTGTTGFPDARKSSDGTTGCPANRCTGYELTEDLTLTGSFEPISNWNVVLEGNGHTISGLRIVNGAGMFQNIGSQAAILNVGFVGPSVTTHDEDGGGIIAGASAGTISNVYIHNGAISGKPGARGIGMIAGTKRSGRISHTYVTGTVTSTAEGAAGTLVGNMQNGTLRNSYSRTNLGVGNGNQFRQYATVAGAFMGGTISSVWEEEEPVSGHPDSGHRTKTETDLREATGFPGWDHAWEFGDACQYPVLKSGGHAAATQTARGAACATK